MASQNPRANTLQRALARLSGFVARLVQLLLDMVAALLGTYYSTKYAAIVRRLGLPRAATSDCPGFVAIQIDGLSHSHLLTAMELGYAPHLQRLVRRGEFSLGGWRSGLPCTTPAAQAGIMFGNNDDIPGFRWYDKGSGESVVCKFPGTVTNIQDRVSAGNPGILAGGSSYLNMFDGDASLSIFTLGALNRKRWFESVRGMGFLLLFVLNPFRAIKLLGLSIWEYLADLTQRTRDLLRHEPLRPLERGYALLRVVNSVIFREIQTFAVLVDIYRGAPAIYTTYTSYDQLAHNYGPLSPVALRALKALDARIRQIDTLRRRLHTRHYDLFVLSDHGMTRSTPFERLYGTTLGDVVQSLLGEGASVEEAQDVDAQDALHMLYLMDELDAIERNVARPLANIPRKIRRLVRQRAGQNRENATSWDLVRRNDVIVRNSGSLSHVYLNVSRKQLSISEIATLYPNLLSDLANHPGIWLVIGREDSQVVVMSRAGVLTIDEAQMVDGGNPLACLPDARLAARQIERLARFPHSGDIILMGSYDRLGEAVTSFERQWGCHGGLGGPQGIAFMLSDSTIPWPLDQVEDATGIYPLFAGRYGAGTAPFALAPQRADATEALE
ncbi:MAG: alkaline phosphatase family protein [Anaerolineae bacterium]